MTTGAPSLVIFDCDGVLVDSEVLSLRVTREVLAEAGCVLSEEEAYANLLGRSLSSMITWLAEARQLEVDDALLAEMRGRLYPCFETALRPIAGVAEAIAALPCKVCVASSSVPDRIALSLGVTGLAPLFGDQVFSATMVARGKPAPDLFLHAARVMGVPPDACAVIEDSPAGITAARAAGMRVAGFVGGSHAGPANLRRAVATCAPDVILSDMGELPAWIAGQIRSE